VLCVRKHVEEKIDIPCPFEHPSFDRVSWAHPVNQTLATSKQCYFPFVTKVGSASGESWDEQEATHVWADQWIEMLKFKTSKNIFFARCQKSINESVLEASKPTPTPQFRLVHHWTSGHHGCWLIGPHHVHITCRILNIPTSYWKVAWISCFYSLLGQVPLWSTPNRKMWQWKRWHPTLR